MIELDQVDVEQVFRDPGKTQGTIPDTEHPVMITVSEHSETRDM